ncbi:hypothetical protein RQ831_18355 [Roseomonas gilardii]|uniref:Transcriptional regulator n=1 Tax=Roseomonas gilardii TaxID=257708 RepID=A0ABU3MJ25_9PROT|nr:hypothetical protein [Roseomonas gilardii]MDT8333019.1 hypothetical protein [Roseomonas gilardii]
MSYPMTTRETLLARIDAFLDQRKMSASAFGVQIMGDPKFLRSLRSGKRGLRLSTIERIEAFISGQEMQPRRSRHQELVPQ